MDEREIRALIKSYFLFGESPQRTQQKLDMTTNDAELIQMHDLVMDDRRLKVFAIFSAVGI